MATNPMSMMMGGGGMGGKMRSPGSPGSPSPDSSFSPSSLMGEDAEAGPTEEQQAKSDSTASLVGEIRGMEETLQSLASRYPDAAAETRRAISAIREVLKKVVSPGVEEPPAPSSMA